MNPCAFLLLAGAVGAGAQAPAASLMRIGAAAAVKGLVQAQAPGAAVGRVVQSGKPLFLNDHVTTDAASRLQVMLLDETVFTMGPNSDMVLDEFVYDPATNAGKVTARVTKGMFRFVTGKVARKDPANMKVKLPVGTIGIRGTIAGGQVSDQGSTIILLGPGSQNNANENPGAINASNAGGDVTITQPGYGTTILPGQPPAGVTNMSQQAQQLTGALGEPPPSRPQSGQGGSASGGSSTGQGGSSASHDSGQTTAQGGTLATQSTEIGQISNALNTDTTNAAQENAKSIANSLSTWDQMRSIETGVVTFSGSGIYAGNIGPTALRVNTSIGNGGIMSVVLDVDFGARTYGGGGSQIYLDPAGLYTNINSTHFGDSGPAVVTLLYEKGNHTDSRFDNTTIQFQNRGGVVAKDIVVNLKYNDGYSTATGNATATAGPRTD